MKLVAIVAGLEPAQNVGVDPLVDLARSAATGNRKAARQLVVAVGPAMLRAVRKVLGSATSDTEDVLQDSVEALLHALATYRRECTVLHFACRVAVLSALAWRRKMSSRARWTADAPELVETSFSPDPSPAEGLSANQRRETLAMLLDDLPPAQSEVLVLHCALGFSIEEIARSANYAVETIRSRLRLAKQALRTRISASHALKEILELSHD